MYDIEKFRYKYIGVGAGFKVIALFLFTMVYFLIRGRTESQRQEESRKTGVELTVKEIMATSLTSLSCMADDIGCHGKRKRASKQRQVSFSSLPGDLAKVKKVLHEDSLLLANR